MRSINSFPLRGARHRSFGVLLLSACFLSSPLTSHANNNGSKSGSTAARPVARLISTSRQEVVKPARYATPVRYAAAAATTATASTVAVAANGDERRVFDLINEERRQRGAQPLSWDGELMRMARLHSQNMAQKSFFDHIDSNGLDAKGRASQFGVRGWRALGENIAYNQGFDDPAAFAVERWMRSSKHRENILNSAFTHTGLGVARAADGRIFFTQVFMTR